MYRKPVIDNSHIIHVYSLHMYYMCKTTCVTQPFTQVYIVYTTHVITYVGIQVQQMFYRRNTHKIPHNHVLQVCHNWPCIQRIPQNGIIGQFPILCDLVGCLEIVGVKDFLPNLFQKRLRSDVRSGEIACHILINFHVQPVIFAHISTCGI